MFDILSIIPGKKKTTMGGWHSFNAICCDKRGHKNDRRMRGGIKFVDENSWTYNCFNCGYSCHFELGRSITKRVKELLMWSGIDEIQIQRWSLESLQNKDLLDFTRKFKKVKPINLQAKELPECDELDVNNEKHKVFVDYLKKRNIDVNKHKFYVTPDDEGRNSNRVIIPFTYNNKIVGHTSRYLDDRKPKFITENQQVGYVFGYDLQKPEWQTCILVEGIFDALSIDGCALTHNNISPEQAQVLRQLNRQIIMVPDRDKPGLDICDTALGLGYSVSLPDWEDDIKDVNDAVIRYGKVPTLLSILQSATTSKIKIEMRRKQIVKGL